MREVGVIIGFHGKPCYWHTPDNRSVVSLPDSLVLWQELWNRRAELMGFAHSHPGGGIPSPSHEDVTTFAAVEAGLGRRLVWWIVNSDYTSVMWYKGPERLRYDCVQVDDPEWATELRKASNGNTEVEK